MMGSAKNLTGGLFSVVGISLVGSLSHVSAQFLLVVFLFVHNLAVSFVIPFLLLSALVGGLVVGYFSDRLLTLAGRLRFPEDAQ